MVRPLPFVSDMRTFVTAVVLTFTVSSRERIEAASDDVKVALDARGLRSLDLITDESIAVDLPAKLSLRLGSLSP